MYMRPVILRIDQNRVQAHAAGAGRPLRPRAMPAQAGQLLPILAAVGRTKDGRVFHAGVDRVRIGERRLQMPDAFEFPRMLRAVVPLMRRQRRRAGDVSYTNLLLSPIGMPSGVVVGCAGRRARLKPRLAAVVRTLNDLPKPAARLRRVDPVRIDRRTLHVVNLPPAEQGPADVPLLPLAVGRKR